MSSDFGAKTAVSPLVDHGLVSRRVVRVVMALDQACVGSSLLACNLKSVKICENPFPLFFFYFGSFKKRSVLMEKCCYGFIATLKPIPTNLFNPDYVVSLFRLKVTFPGFLNISPDSR